MFYHATIPYFAEEIVESGLIKPSSQLDVSHQGWNFSEVTLGHQYGSEIFLATNDEKYLAIHYAFLRLKNLWDEIPYESREDIITEEDLRFVGVFKIYIDEFSKKLGKTSGDIGEYHYFGSIGKNPKDEVYWIGPEWVSFEKEADQHYDKMIDVERQAAK